MTSERIRSSPITLLGDGKLDTLALGQADPRLLLTNDEAVGKSVSVMHASQS